MNMKLKNPPKDKQLALSVNSQSTRVTQSRHAHRSQPSLNLKPKQEYLVEKLAF